MHRSTRASTQALQTRRNQRLVAYGTNEKAYFLKVKQKWFLIYFCNLLKFIHAPYFLTYPGRKYMLVEKQISTLTYKYRFHKRSDKFVNFRSSHW